MKDDALERKPVEGRSKASMTSPRSYMSPAEQEKLLQALVNDFSSQPDEKSPTQNAIAVQAKIHGYDLSISWVKKLRAELKRRAPDLFSNERSYVTLSEKENGEIVKLLIASYKADSHTRFISIPDVVKRSQALGYRMTRYWGSLVRKKIQKLEPELGRRMVRQPSTRDQSSKTRNRKRDSQVLRVRVDQGIGRLFSTFANTMGFTDRQYGSAFELLMKVLAQGMLSHQLNLTHSLQQARTLRPEDISAIVRVLEQVDWSVTENPRQ